MRCASVCVRMFDPSPFGERVRVRAYPATRLPLSLAPNGDIVIAIRLLVKLKFPDPRC